jgi:hypothetical protein
MMRHIFLPLFCILCTDREQSAGEPPSSLFNHLTESW